MIEDTRLMGPMHLKMQEDPEATFIPCQFEDADLSTWVMTDKHPVDGHEYGLMAQVIPASEELHEARYDQMCEGMGQYLFDTPDGLEDPGAEIRDGEST